MKNVKYAGVDLAITIIDEINATNFKFCMQ